MQDARRELFDALRPFVPNRRFTQAQVSVIDGIADLLGVPKGAEKPTASPTPVIGLRASKAAFEIIKEFEGCKLEAYLCPAGVWTIGWGATGPGIFKGVTWTQEQADARLVQDVEDTANGVRTLIGNKPTTQGQFDAMVSFAYNVGTDIDNDTTPEGLGDSSLLRKHLAGDFEGAANEFLKWNKARQNGRLVALKGLTRRREMERLLYLQ